MNKKTSFNWLGAIQIGLIGGAVALLVSLIGMVEEFSQRDIISGVITMGQTLIVIAILMAGYFAASRSEGEARPMRPVGGALAGLTSSALLAGLVLIIPPLDLRSIFPNASPALIKILTFDQETAGIVYLLITGAVVGALGGLIDILSSQIRRSVILALFWVGLLGLLQELIRVTLTNMPQVGAALKWMFGSRGLSIPGAITVFIVVAGGSYLWAVRGGQAQDRFRALPPAQRRATQWGATLLAIAVVLYLPNVLGSYLSEVANQVGLFILMGLGLNIVVGFAGLLDLGYVAFYAVGAYVMGVLTTNAVGGNAGQIVFGPQLTFWQTLPIAVAAAVLMGVILGIPVLKMRGDYLAIVTLGFGEIIRILALSDFLKPYIGGSQGIVEVGQGQVGSFVFGTPQTLYYMIFAGCLLALFISWRLRDSRPGRAWKALREDEDVAQAMGINLVATKLLAFATGAAFSGLSGAIFASKIGSIYPHSFNLLISINVLALIIVGGMGSLPGVFVGALVLVGLPELLREFSEYRLLMYGVLLIVMMLTRPEGFWPEATHKREFHEDAAEAPPAATTT
jgi:branched-chain amino acid transport system permease protein